MKPAISQISSLAAPFERDVEDYRAAACEAIEIYLGKLETYLNEHSLDDVRRLLDQHQMAAPVASFQGGLFVQDEQAAAEHWHLLARRLEMLQRLGTRTLVVAGDLAEPAAGQEVERIRAALRRAAQHAAPHNVRIAFEFQGRATFANNLRTAAALVADCGEPNLGICFDVFHYYTGPSKLEDLAALTAENLFHVQLCDLAGQPREWASDGDRVLPGDGDFQLQPIVEHLRAIGYEGYVSLEVMNPQIWQIPPLQLAEVGMTALRKVLGEAAME